MKEEQSGRLYAFDVGGVQRIGVNEVRPLTVRVHAEDRDAAKGFGSEVLDSVGSVTGPLPSHLPEGASRGVVSKACGFPTMPEGDSGPARPLQGLVLGKKKELRPSYYKVKVLVTLESGERVKATLECFDLQDALDLAPYSWNVLKYLFRCGRKHKDRLEDLRKVKTYADQALLRETGEGPQGG